MGKKIKTTNRGLAINRNAARIQKLAEKVGELRQEMKAGFKKLAAEARAADEAFQNFHEVIGERLVELEIPWWRKLFMMGRKPPALDFELDVLPEIERQCGPVPAEVKETCKAEAAELVEAMIGQREEDKVKDKKVDKKKRGDPASPNHRAVIMDPSTVRSRPKSEEEKEKKDGK